jgi:hypothetical protein
MQVIEQNFFEVPEHGNATAARFENASTLQRFNASTSAP